MAFREIGGSKKYRNWSLWEEGDYIVGKFTGTTMDNFGKENYNIEISETNIEFDPDHHYIPTKGKNRGKKVYDVKIEEGETISLNHSGSLAYKMDQVNNGEVVKVIYRGTEVLPDNHQFAGAECHQMEVLVAETSEGDPVEDGDEIDSFSQL
jgi:hypothetical protein